MFRYTPAADSICWNNASSQQIVLSAKQTQQMTFSYARVFSARCNIYISCLCYDVSVRLYVCLSLTEVYWRIIANLGFKFRCQFTVHCGHGACGREGRDHRREDWRGSSCTML